METGERVWFAPDAEDWKPSSWVGPPYWADVEEFMSYGPCILVFGKPLEEGTGRHPNCWAVATYWFNPGTKPEEVERLKQVCVDVATLQLDAWKRENVK